MERFKQKLQAAAIPFRENEPLAAHCTFKIGGPAQLFVMPENEQQLCSAVALCKEQAVRYYLLGNGSNILFADEGFSGVVIDVSALDAEIAVEERFLKEGLDHFDRHQIVEMLLFFGIPRKDTNATAHRLIETFGGLPGVLEAPYEELCRVEGVTANAAVLISFCGQMFRTYYHDKFAAGTILSTVEEAGQYLLPQFLGRREETVYLVAWTTRTR